MRTQGNGENHKKDYKASKEIKEWFSFHAKTFGGLETMLARELELLGAKNIKTVRRGVTFTGDTRLLYEANLKLRTALRVLVKIAYFKTFNPDDLYEQTTKIPWEDYFHTGQTFAVDSTVFSPTYKMTNFPSLKVKDAIVDRFRKRYGLRPDVQKDNPDIRIDVHISGEHCTISLDSSGESLAHRGYRTDAARAPLNEVLAAGILKHSGWDGKQTLLDPMCGSGTLLAEAAYIATNTPPAWLRKRFCFMNWVSFEKKIWNDVRSEAEAQIVKSMTTIIGRDISDRTVYVATRNISATGRPVEVTIEKGDYFKADRPAATGTIVCNPPYGERIQLADASQFFGDFGTRLKHHYAGWTATIFALEMEALHRIGLKPSRKTPINNGSMNCLMQNFRLFAAEKEELNQNDDEKQ